MFSFRISHLPPARVRTIAALVLFGIVASAWIYGHRKWRDVELGPHVASGELVGVWTAGGPPGPGSYALWLHASGRFAYLRPTAPGERRGEVRGRWTLEDGARVRLVPGRALPSAGGDAGAAVGPVTWEAAEPVTLRLLRVSGRLHLVRNFESGFQWDRRSGFVQFSRPQADSDSRESAGDSASQSSER
jgi:hypothetical protein